MDMSAAALPPITGTTSKADETHPLFPLWRQAEASNQRLMINGQNFRDWLFQYERNQRNDDAAKHSEYLNFLAWMRANQGGARPCCPSKEMPNGLNFPANFHYWLAGGRW
jgi:hypothetical protein